MMSSSKQVQLCLDWLSVAEKETWIFYALCWLVSQITLLKNEEKGRVLKKRIAFIININININNNNIFYNF